VKFMTFEFVLVFATLASFIAWICKKLNVGNTKELTKKPFWIRYIANNFLLLFFVLIFRTFFFESFMVPSRSMVPTIIPGDFIAVSKHAYGIRLPLMDHDLISFPPPKAGEIVVFKHPLTPEIHYIKRVIGVPGDVVSYLDKRLTVNGSLLEVSANGKFKNDKKDYLSDLFSEKINGITHEIIIDKESFSKIVNAEQYPFKDNCKYLENGVVCTVPKDNYFVMGDNRDNSIDSRSWGFVPQSNIIGEASFIWLNPADLTRIRKL
jgi:signal peptidase I